MTSQDIIRVEIPQGNGRTTIRFIDPSRLPDASKRANIPTPMLGNDNLDRVCWGPDGKAHTSKASLRASYLPSGNPEGNRYVELGNDYNTPIASPKEVDTKGIDASIQRALQRANAV